MIEGDPRGVFYDLFDDPDVAADLTARSDLMIAITARIRAQGWTHAETARLLHITPRRASDLLNEQLYEFSLDALESMLPAVGIADRP